MIQTVKPLMVIAAVFLLSDTLAADTSGITRSLLQEFDVPQDVARKCVFGLAELAPGANIGRHLHHGVEAGYVLSGELRLEIDGEDIRLLRAGDSYQIPSGKVHDATSVGTDPARVNAVWVVEKGKPLSVAVD